MSIGNVYLPNDNVVLFVDGNTNQRWAFNRHNNDDDDDEFVTRFDRMTGAGNDFSVFTSNLPG